MPNNQDAREADVLVAIQSALFDVPGVVPSARGLSHLGEHALGWLGMSAVGCALDARRRRQWFTLGAAAFVAHAISVVLKRIVRRRRPHDERIRIGVATPSALSFPSSHATSTTAAMVVLAKVTGSRLPWLGVPVMMLSRMVLGVHYPTDTLVGAGIGAATAAAATRIERNSR
ncbi:phosphatase PAP2 family protein [Corynebacterium uterequi]|uniref:5'-phosphoribosyl-monophospho-decaprenol phosphatase n=1 Tax=Corynebacterium uterequi TaxID=1072256 RepID=A0A0G3HGZ1_9CORY|nr:phosphatase PAP2 family protein [Corynebacterium uterequi]AKK12050.1 5'-phosphoribosyl-monophospho-decaprenol phosphatase [Corynebacterium uterequi]